VEQATPGDAGSRAENLGPAGRTRAGDPGAGTLAEPQGARARNAWRSRADVVERRRMHRRAWGKGPASLRAGWPPRAR
jgi:hypothetical protein